MNFEQILRQKMQETPSQNSSASSFETRGTDPAHLAFLIGQINRLQSQKPTASAYKPTVFPRKPHTFTNEQQLAFDFFCKHQPTLSNAFTRAELKNAFRKIALQVHPDQGGSAQEFVLLRDHYKTLSSIPKK